MSPSRTKALGAKSTQRLFFEFPQTDAHRSGYTELPPVPDIEAFALPGKAWPRSGPAAAKVSAYQRKLLTSPTAPKLLGPRLFGASAALAHRAWRATPSLVLGRAALEKWGAPVLRWAPLSAQPALALMALAPPAALPPPRLRGALDIPWRGGPSFAELCALGPSAPEFWAPVPPPALPSSAWVSSRGRFAHRPLAIPPRLGADPRPEWGGVPFAAHARLEPFPKSPHFHPWPPGHSSRWAVCLFVTENKKPALKWFEFERIILSSFIYPPPWSDFVYVRPDYHQPSLFNLSWLLEDRHLPEVVYDG